MRGSSEALKFGSSGVREFARAGIQEFSNQSPALPSGQGDPLAPLMRAPGPGHAVRQTR